MDQLEDKEKLPYQINEKLLIKIVDTREPIEIREKLLEIGWQQKAMTSGDYFFYSHDFKKIGIERKTVDDLLTSIGDRLARQLEQCFDFYDTTILIIEGSWKAVSEQDNIVSGRGIERSTWKSIWNYLHQFKRKGLIDELTVNEGHTIKRVNELYALYQKTYSTSGKSKDFDDDRILAFPSGVRGKTAIDCLNKFGSLKAVINAKPEEYLEVNNVGYKKAEKMWHHFNIDKRVEKNNDELLKSMVDNVDDVAKEEDGIQQRLV